ncbi:MAG: T9SS type A sorting domain-containing protein [Bacteroidia bacterium]
MKTLFRLFVFLGIVMPSFGQKEANIWYFGSDGAGLDFNTNCVPVALTNGKINGFEGCATVSHPSTGQLLFYTNSERVWDRNHDTMVNSYLVQNGNTVTQVAIIKKPGSASQYYIITSEVQAGLASFPAVGYQFHMVDMTLNGGLGGIVYKDSLLFATPTTEKLTAVRHFNGTDIWLIGHQYNTNKYLAFLITSSGINKTPVVSQIGKVQGDMSTEDAIGELKASPNGSKLAAVTLRDPNIELFDFNNSTGQISNLITLKENGCYSTSGNASGLYGLSFSPNSSKLYASEWASPSLSNTGKVFQFDISSNDSTIINGTKAVVYSSATESFYSLKLGPDGKMYVAYNTYAGPAGTYLGVVNFPDNSAASCGYTHLGIYLNGKHAGWGLNNMMEAQSFCTPLGIENPNGSETRLQIFPNPVTDGNLTVETGSLQNHLIRICDVNGKLLFSGNAAARVTIDVSEFGEGIYMLSISDIATTITKKLVVIK